MTDKQRLAEIEARLKAALPGPWVFNERADAIFNRDAYNAWVANNHQGDRPYALEAMWCNDGTTDFNGSEANRSLIINAPTDIAWLIEQLKARM